MLSRYKSLGRKTQRTWDRLRWGKEDVAQLRERLISQTLLLTAFTSSIASSSHVRLEQKLHDFMEEIREGKREGSIISTNNGPELDVDDQEVWAQLRRELEDLGISSAVLHVNMEFIKNWFKEAFAQSSLEEVRSSAKDRNKVLLSAALRGDTALVEKLIASGVDLNYTQRKLGWNALHMAAAGGHEQIVKALVDAGMDLETEDGNKRPLLHLAVARGNVAVAEVLLRNGINVDESMPCGLTALHLAAHHGRTTMVEKLLSHGANPNIQSKTHEYTPLHSAAFFGHSETGKALIEAGADINARSISQEITSLHIAAESGYNGLLRVLIIAGADINARNRETSQRYTLLRRKVIKMPRNC